MYPFGYSGENVEVHIKRVKSFLPPQGQVGILSITDKQLGSMESFTEKKERRAPIECSQLELFCSQYKPYICNIKLHS